MRYPDHLELHRNARRLRSQYLRTLAEGVKWPAFLKFPRATDHGPQPREITATPYPRC